MFYVRVFENLRKKMKLNLGKNLNLNFKMKLNLWKFLNLNLNLSKDIVLGKKILILK